MKEYMKVGSAFAGGIGFSVRHSDGQVRIGTHAINSHDELVEMNKELLSELKTMAKAYVKLMESGKDRIESLGGYCDEVAYMAAHDANLVHACSVIGKYYGGAA